MAPTTVGRRRQRGLMCLQARQRGALTAATIALGQIRITPRMRPVIKRDHLRSAIFQHRALVDVALVGDLAAVGARRLVLHERAHRALRRAAAFGRAAGAWLAARAYCSSPSGKALACGVGNTSRPISERSWPVITTSATCGAIALTMRGLQRPDADPGAAGQLEVLRHAAVEGDALRRIGLVDQLAGVADLVEAFLVEGRGRQRVLVAGSRERCWGPCTRISSLLPLGTNFSSPPGSGRPRQPAFSMRQCTAVRPARSRWRPRRR